MITHVNLETGERWTEGDKPPANPVPQVVSKFQGKAALMQAGLLSDAQQIVANSSDMVKLAWDEASEWRRNSPMIAAVAGLGGLDLTDDEIDDLFRAAKEIKA